MVFLSYAILVFQKQMNLQDIQMKNAIYTECITKMVEEHYLSISDDQKEILWKSNCFKL